MAEGKQMASELGYVSSLVKKSERNPSPAAIHLLWAAISLVGFSMVDFAPRAVGAFWAIAGPLGGLLSAFLGWRYSVRRGQVDRDEGMRHMLHWFGMMAIIFLSVLLASTGAVAWPALARMILLLLALTYFLAGVHLERPLIWVGALMAGCYLALFLIPAYGWTVVGIVVALGMVATTRMGGPRRVAPADAA